MPKFMANRKHDKKKKKVQKTVQGYKKENKSSAIVEVIAWSGIEWVLLKGSTILKQEQKAEWTWEHLAHRRCMIKFNILFAVLNAKFHIFDEL